MPSLPSYINPELNLVPPPAIDHAESDADSEDEDSDRYELVTFRIPVDVKLSELHGTKIDLQALSKKKIVGGGLEIRDGQFFVQEGDSNENETFRILVPDSTNNINDSSSGDDDNSDNSDSDDNNDGKAESKFLLHPSKKAFARHFNVTKNRLVKKSETELAPSLGPDPVGCTLKHSYSHIPQRKGLKRRWMPLGNKQEAIVVSPRLISMKSSKATTTTTTATQDDEDASTEQLPETPIKQEKKSPTKKRRRSNSNSNAKETEPATVLAEGGSSQKKKRSRSKESSTVIKQQEKEKKSEKKAKKAKAKKSKKTKKEEDDALSV